MRRDEIGEMSVFVAVVRSQGFRAAAKQLNLHPGSVSQSVQRLEDRLGYQLLNRTTRKLSLTEAGKTLFGRCSPAISDMEEVIRELDEAKDDISGTLKLNAPRAVGTCFLDTLLAKYAVKYPAVKLEIMYQDDKVDLVESGTDAAIRIGGLLEKDTYAVPIGPELDMAVIATPQYIQTHGAPHHPADIAQHKGICYKQKSAANIYAWQFNEEGNEYSIVPTPAVVVNDSDSILQFVLAHIGIGYVYKHEAQPFIEQDKCIQLLENYTSSQGRYSINYISKKHMPKRLRAFIDMAVRIT